MNPRLSRANINRLRLKSSADGVQRAEYYCNTGLFDHGNVGSVVPCNKIWSELYQFRDKLIDQGFIRLPSVLGFVDIDEYSQKIIKEVGGKTFFELSPSHSDLLGVLGINTVLSVMLFDLAKEFFGYNGRLNNQYHVARLVHPGNIVEQYRAHFDSHLFTLVIPLVIPVTSFGEEVGELLFLPKARRNPRCEIENIVGKIYFKRYSSRSGVESLLCKKQFQTECFSDRRLLLFLGRTTFHVNKGVAFEASSSRLTLLSHFFDPSPRFGISKIMRALRDR